MKVIVTGGGTGGHIYPALAFIRYLKSVDENAEVLYIGTQKGLESQLVPDEGISFETIEIQGIRRSLSLSNFKTLSLLVSSLKKAKRLIKDFSPDLVIGTGGYVSAPVLIAAMRLHLPTIIHEQNSYPGLTNRYLGKRATRVALAIEAAKSYFPESKAVFTGNPRAQEVVLAAKAKDLSGYGLSNDKKTLIIFGGSRGAQKINEAVLEALPAFAKADYQVLYASGKAYYADYQKDFVKFDKAKNVAIVPYIEDMPAVFGAASLFVGRSGATTIAEVSALGLPAIFIPSPNVVADHQTKNALALVEAGAAKLIKDEALNAETLLQEISKIFSNPELYQKMHEKSLEQGVQDASQRLYQLAKEIIQRKK